MEHKVSLLSLHSKNVSCWISYKRWTNKFVACSTQVPWQPKHQTAYHRTLIFSGRLVYPKTSELQVDMYFVFQFNYKHLILFSHKTQQSIRFTDNVDQRTLKMFLVTFLCPNYRSLYLHIGKKLKTKNSETEFPKHVHVDLIYYIWPIRPIWTVP